MPPELEAALCCVADELARLPLSEFDQLCVEELKALIGVGQFLEAFPAVDALPPAYLLGQRIITLLTKRHPDFATDVAGTA
jgi:hypothetical protein